MTWQPEGSRRRSWLRFQASAPRSREAQARAVASIGICGVVGALPQQDPRRLADDRGAVGNILAYDGACADLNIASNLNPSLMSTAPAPIRQRGPMTGARPATSPMVTF